MIEYLAIFGGSFMLALSGALMPGPLFTVTLSESARTGFRAGPLLITGHSILELALVAAVLLGLGPYLKLPTVTGVVALLGGTLLVYLGWDMLRSAGRLSLRWDPAADKRSGARHPVVMGALASLANPYWTLWWATIGLGYLIAAMKYGAPGVVLFFVGHIAADFAWYSLVSFGVSRGKTLLGDSGYRWTLRACGAVLIFFGGWFLISARDFLGSLAT